MAGAVITFWSNGESDPQITFFVTTRTELLSEAENAFSFRNQSTTPPSASPNVPSPMN
jgi:hypothetical protein